MVSDKKNPKQQKEEQRKARVVQRKREKKRAFLKTHDDGLRHGSGRVPQSPLQRQPNPAGLTRQRIIQHHQFASLAIQRQGELVPAGGEPDIAQAIEQQRGGGHTLPQDIQTQLEPTIGTDLSTVRVHTDAKADQLSRSVQAKAFTTGSDIFFRSGQYSPASSDGQQLIAHEATHVRQQREGPVNGTPASGGIAISDPHDSFEREADTTAQRAIQRMADDTPPPLPTEAWFQRPTTIQRNTTNEPNSNGNNPKSNLPRLVGRLPDKESTPPNMEVTPITPELTIQTSRDSAWVQREEGDSTALLPDGVNYSVANGEIVVRHSWLKQDPAYKATDKTTQAPTAMIELLQVTRATGTFYWLTDEHIQRIAPLLVLNDVSTGDQTNDSFVRISFALSVYQATGTAPGTNAIQWQRMGQDMGLIVDKNLLSNEEEKKRETGLAIVDALEVHTGLYIPDREHAERIAGLFAKNWVGEVDEDFEAKAGIIPYKDLVRIYGQEVWDAHLENKPPATTAGENQEGQYGLVFASRISPEDQAYFKEFLAKVSKDKAPQDPTEESASETSFITQDFIDKIKSIEEHEHKEDIYDLLRNGTGGSSRVLTMDSLDQVINQVEFDHTFEEHNVDKPSRSGKVEDPLVNLPVDGAIINRSGRTFLMEPAEFFFEVKHKPTHHLNFRVAWQQVRWAVHRKEDPDNILITDDSVYIDDPNRSIDYFDLTFPEKGVYTIHAFVYHNYYLPKHFSIDVEVKSEEERMDELRTEAFTGLGAFESSERDFNTSLSNEFLGDDIYEIGKKFGGSLPEDFQRRSFEEQIKFIKEDRRKVQLFIEQYENSTNLRNLKLVEYAKEYLQKLDETEADLRSEQDDGYVFFESRATYLSRKPGIPDKQLNILTSVKRREHDVKVIIHDFTQLYEPKDYTFRGTGDSFSSAIEEGFVDMCKAYPPGRMSFLAEKLPNDVATQTPLDSTIGFELDTGTAWKDIKSVVYNPYVQVGVNVLGVLLMVFFPVAAVPILLGTIAYNAIAEVDRLEDLWNKGNLEWQNVAGAVGMIGLELLPFLGKAKFLLRAGRRTLFVVEGIELAGQTVIMTGEALTQLEDLRNKDIKELADLEEQIRELERTNAADPKLKQLKETRDQKAEALRNHAQKKFATLAATAAITILPGATFAELSRRGFKRQVEDMIADGVIINKAGAKPSYDPETGRIYADTNKVTALQLEDLHKQYMNDLAGYQTQLQDVLGTQNVKIVRADVDTPSAVKTDDGYEVVLPNGVSQIDSMRALLGELRVAARPKGQKLLTGPTMDDAPKQLTGPTIDDAPKQLTGPTTDDAPKQLTGPTTDDAPKQLTGPTTDDAPKQLTGPTLDDAPKQLTGPTSDTAPKQLTGPTLDDAPKQLTGPTPDTAPKQLTGPTLETAPKQLTGPTADMLEQVGTTSPKAQAFRDVLATGGNAKQAARELVDEAGDLNALRSRVTSKEFGDDVSDIQQVLQEGRQAIIKDAEDLVKLTVESRHPGIQLTSFAPGTPGFTSDIDISVIAKCERRLKVEALLAQQGKKDSPLAQEVLDGLGLPAGQRAELETLLTKGELKPRDVDRFLTLDDIKREVTASLDGSSEFYKVIDDPDKRLDANFYSILNESGITRHASDREKVATIHDQTAVSLAELKRNISPDQWEAYKTKQLGEIDERTDPFIAERMKAQFDKAEAIALELEGKSLDTVKADLMALLKDPSATIPEIREAMAKIKMMEPDAYGTNAAFKEVVEHMQVATRYADEMTDDIPTLLKKLEKLQENDQTLTITNMTVDFERLNSDSAYFQEVWDELAGAQRQARSTTDDILDSRTDWLQYHDGTEVLAKGSPEFYAYAAQTMTANKGKMMHTPESKPYSIAKYLRRIMFPALELGIPAKRQYFTDRELQAMIRAKKAEDPVAAVNEVLQAWAKRRNFTGSPENLKRKWANDANQMADEMLLEIQVASQFEFHNRQQRMIRTTLETATPNQLRADVDFQDDLFEHVKQHKRTQEGFAREMASDVEVNATVQIPLSDKQTFVDELLQRARMRGVNQLNEVDDMLAGEIIVSSTQDAGKVYEQMLDSGWEIAETMQPSGGRGSYYVTLVEAETGLPIQWRIGP